MYDLRIYWHSPDIIFHPVSTSARDASVPWRKSGFGTERRKPDCAGSGIN